MNTSELICKRCKNPVVENKDQYDVFEQMHWLCFHLEFEHEGDPDVACSDPSCPWWQIEVLKNELVQMGIDPTQVINQAVKTRWKL